MSKTFINQYRILKNDFIMGILASFWNISSNVRLIFRHKTAISRAELFFAYIKLVLKSFFFVVLLRVNIKKEEIFGFKLGFFSYPAFLMSFDEIFIKKGYYFNSKKNNPFIIDCGANIGLATIFFKKLYPKSRIISFEPDKRAFELLKKNIEINKLEYVELHNKAIHNSEGKIRFYFDAGNPASLAMSTDKKRMPKSSVIVDAAALSKHIKGEVDFLKMDIEGSEELVIEELSAKNKLKMVREMVIEYHHHIDENQDKMSNILNILEKNGFGYQFDTAFAAPFIGKKFQDMLIYAYRK